MEIVIGNTQSVEFFAQSEILDLLNYKIVNGILGIGFEPEYSVKTIKEITARLVIPSVNFLSISGEGNFKISGEQQDKLDINISGYGNVKAFDMEVKKSKIQVSGIGNCEVNFINTLDVTISGVGNVIYKGSQNLTMNFCGLGNVITMLF